MRVSKSVTHDRFDSQPESLNHALRMLADVSPQLGGRFNSRLTSLRIQIPKHRRIAAFPCHRGGFPRSLAPGVP